MANYRNIPSGQSIMDYTKDETCVLVTDYEQMDKLYSLLVADWDGQDNTVLKTINAIHDSMKAATERKLDREAK